MSYKIGINKRSNRVICGILFENIIIGKSTQNENFKIKIIQCSYYTI